MGYKEYKVEWAFDNRRSASFTVEATFVMIIFIWVIMILLYGAIYIHDETVMKSLLQLRLQQGYTEETEIKKVVQEKLFLIQCDEVKATQGILHDKLILSYHVNIRDKLIQKVLLGSKEHREICVEKGKGTPAELIWTATVIGED